VKEMTPLSQKCEGGFFVAKTERDGEPMDKVKQNDWMKFRVNRDLRERFKAQAQAEGATMSAILRAAIGAVCPDPGEPPGEGAEGGADERQGQQ